MSFGFVEVEGAETTLTSTRTSLDHTTQFPFRIAFRSVMDEFLYQTLLRGALPTGVWFTFPFSRLSFRFVCLCQGLFRARSGLGLGLGLGFRKGMKKVIMPCAHFRVFSG